MSSLFWDKGGRIGDRVKRMMETPAVKRMVSVMRICLKSGVLGCLSILETRTTNSTVSVSLADSQNQELTIGNSTWYPGISLKDNICMKSKIPTARNALEKMNILAEEGPLKKSHPCSAMLIAIKIAENSKIVWKIR